MINKALKFIFLFILIFFTNELTAQQWMHYYGGPLEDKAYAISADHAGYVYIAGYRSTANDGTDFYILKINPGTGSKIWDRSYNGSASQDDKVYAITVDRENNVYIAGYSTGIGTGTDITVIKYNSSGTRQWIGIYNSTTNGNDGAYGVAVDDSLNVYVTGFVTHTGKDMYLAKFNSSGVYQWGRFYGGTKGADDKAYAVRLDNSDNIYIGGYSINNGTRADFTVIKYNRITGDEIWVGKYDSPYHFDDVADCMELSESGHLYLAGWRNRDSSGDNEDFLTVKFNTENGDTLWARTYNGSGGNADKVYAITVDKLSNLYITGSVTSQSTAGNPNSYNLDFMTIKYSKEGDMLWHTAYDTSLNNDVAKGLCLSSTEDYLFVTGFTRKGNDPDSQDIATVKYNALNGEQLQASIMNGPGNGEDDVIGILLDSTDNTFLAGYMKNISTDLDIIAAKYERGNLIEVKNVSLSLPKNFNLYQNYPNPFNPATTIKFDINKQGRVRIVIFDMLGRQTDVLVNENLRAGSYEVNYSSLKLSSGVYFYEMTVGDYRDVKKMILIK